MKGHIGVDSKEKFIHSVGVTAANVHDSQIIAGLLQGNETKVWGDSAYQGQKYVIRKIAPKAKDMTNKCGARYKTPTEIDY